MDEIIIIGTGGHARSCIDVIEQQNKYKIAGLVEKDRSQAKNIYGYPIIGYDDKIEQLVGFYKFVLIGIGQIKSPNKRSEFYDKLKIMGFNLPSIISPRAYVSKHAQISEGTIVMHDCIVNANAQIGNNCIINTGSLIEHDTLIGDNCHISTGALINGEVVIGSGTFIGSGCITKHNITIGTNCLIGAGITLNNDINKNSIIKNYE